MPVNTAATNPEITRMEASDVARLDQHSGVRRRESIPHTQRQSLQSCTTIARLRNTNVELHASQEPRMQLAQLIASTALVVLVAHQSAAAEDRPRARDLGIAPGVMEPGPLNAITDVAGVK